MSESVSRRTSRVMIVGEVLWDCFAEHRVLGGAPFNVAWNLAGFGVDAVMVSAIGADDLGHEILGRMQRWGLTTEGIAVLENRPTGTVNVSLENGEPTYEITADVAWDAIPAPSLELDRMDFIYFGSLAWRSETTRHTIQQLRQRYSAPVFVDVNIRMPHFDKQWLPAMLGGARCVKLNEHELSQLVDRSLATAIEREQAARQLMGQYRIRELYVTRGADGAEWYSDVGDRVEVAAPAPKNWVDAVGAGDAFTAVVLWGQLHHVERETSLHDAVHFAADVCGLSGATSDDKTFYQPGFIHSRNSMIEKQ